MVDQLQNMSHELNPPQVPLLLRLGPAMDLTAQAMAFFPAHFPASSFTGETQVLTKQEILLGKGTRVESSRVTEPRRTALPRGPLTFVSPHIPFRPNACDYMPSKNVLVCKHK